jgi:hypothetical protein
MGAPPIDATDMVTGAIDSVETGVGDNLPAIGALAGTLLAVGVVWRFAKRFIK